MNRKRFEHPGTNRFWEIYWDVDEVEMCSGAIGTKGRMSRPRGAGGVQRVVEGEIAKKRREGYVEVRPESAGDAPQAPRAPAWIARIAEAYDDDAPRLVYADWLQGQGDPLGELIMVQCERARLERWDPKQKPLRDREQHLLAMYRSRWLPDPTANVEWERGSIARIRISYPFDRAAIARLLDAAPLARSLEISPASSYSDMGPEALDQLELRQFSGLFIKGFRWDESRVRRLIEDERLVAIDRLGLAGCSLGGGDLEALRRRSFRQLDLHNNALGIRGIQFALASAATLVELDLTNAGINDHAVILIAEARLPQLERLRLRQNPLTVDSIERMTGMPRLRSLDLAHTTPGQPGIEALGGATLPALRELDLRETELTDEMVIAFARGSLIRQLAWIDLGHNEIGAAAAQALAAVDLPALRWLDVGSTRMGDEVAHLKQAHPHARVVGRAR